MSLILIIYMMVMLQDFNVPVKQLKVVHQDVLFLK